MVLPVCGVALIFVVIAIFCICSYYRAREEEKLNESVDVNMDNSGFRNINNTVDETQDEEGATTVN